MFRLVSNLFLVLLLDISGISLSYEKFKCFPMIAHCANSMMIGQFNLTISGLHNLYLGSTVNSLSPAD